MPTLTISYNTRKIEILGRNATRSKHPSHVLHTAAIFGDIKLTAAALASGQPVNAFYDGITPLHAAARAGKATVVHMLIGAGAYVNTGRLPSRPQVGQEGDSGDATDFRTAWRDGYVGTEGCTPLHFAAANGHLDVLVFLLDQGADYQKPDKHGITPLMLAESIGQMNTITALRDWDSKNPPIDQSVFSSTSSYIVAAPNNIKSKRSLQGFLPRPWKGSLLNQLFPRRSRSSTSIRRLSIGSEKRGNLGSENSSTALGSEASQLDLNMSPRSGRPYQDNSRDSSFSSFGSSLGLTRTHESRNSVTTWENGKDRARMLTGLSIQEDRKWGSEARTGTPEGMKGVMPVQEGEAAVEIGLETSGANILAGESSLQLDCKANDSYPDEISEDQPVGVSNVVQEHTEDDCGENSALWEQAVTGDLASPPPAKLRQSPISQFMPANEIVRHLTEHRCQDITDRLDASSCGSQPVSWGGFGEVFFGNLLDGTEVAIKTARDLISPSDESRKSLKV
ncbi:hypothetical protein FRC08_007015 [Ceratobasidium sp. 394]|nr:hypothetical protein FRC08_007015 [Ceratobasidium sp. 394]